MTAISEAIKTIKEAENNADELVNDSKAKSIEMIENANLESTNIIKEAKESAKDQAKDIIFKIEENARKEARLIIDKTEKNVNVFENESRSNIDEAASIIVKNIL